MNLRAALLKGSLELSEVGIPTSDLDTRVLLLNAIDQDEKYLILNPLSPFTNAQYSKFRRYICRRKKGEPVAYITGHKEFYGLDFEVNKNVLIPRPETELLVEQALQYLRTKGLKNSMTINLIDIGTGSGCIIVSVAKELQATSYKLKVNLFASDISEKALRIAKKNAKEHGVANEIKFYHSDLLSNNRLPKKFDLIIANLPYLRPDYQGLDFEPRTALDGGDDGLKIVRRLIDSLADKLNAGGVALLEIDNSQLKTVRRIVDESKDFCIEEIKTIPTWHGSVQITRK